MIKQQRFHTENTEAFCRILGIILFFSNKKQFTTRRDVTTQQLFSTLSFWNTIYDYLQLVMKVAKTCALIIFASFTMVMLCLTSLKAFRSVKVRKPSSPLKTLFRDRREKVNTYCKRRLENNRDTLTYVPSKLIVLQDKNVSWCPVFKSGSSTWLTALFELSDTSEALKDAIKLEYSENLLKRIRRIAPPLTMKEWLKYKAKYTDSFLVVRHPFERIVSAYRDKLERIHSDTYDTDYYYTNYGAHIVEMYRERALEEFNDNTFTELPVFWEFVQYLLHSDPFGFDEHWLPISLHCSMCRIDYNYIIKFEDFTNEGSAFLRLTGLTNDTSLIEKPINSYHPDSVSRLVSICTHNFLTN